ncbi:MAG TPA: FAD-dependent monooxygenase, partial [Thermoanaerobaculia bacterium]
MLQPVPSDDRLPDAATAGRHAIVIGGSIAGLFAARVLADSFERVTLIERDELPDEVEVRPGAPHAHHLHLLLKRGLEIIEQLFPAVKDDLLAQGVHVLDQGKDFQIHYLSGWAPQRSCDLEILTFTRPLLETTIRRHLLAEPRVALLAGTSVCGLVADPSGTAVAGVRYQPRVATPQSEERTLAADLVVDASGRHSQAAAWLAELGYPALEQTVVDALWGYASRIYKVPPGFSARWKSLLLMHRPPVLTRAGIIQPIEGDRWMVTLAGVMEDYPPTDEEGFLAYARALAQPDLY